MTPGTPSTPRSSDATPADILEVTGSFRFTSSSSTIMDVNEYHLEADSATSDTIKDHDSDGSSETEYMDGLGDTSNDNDSDPELDKFITSQASFVDFSNDTSDEASLADTVDEFSADCCPPDASDVSDV